jgi:hypothetical protein
MKVEHLSPRWNLCFGGETMNEEIAKEMPLQIDKAQIVLDLKWILTFDLVYQHRQVRRVAPDPVGVRFVCTDDNGVHACFQEAVEANRTMDLYDLVPKNHAERLGELLGESSDKDGSVSVAAQHSLDQILERRGVHADQRDSLLALKGLSALEYLFQVIERALDLKFPPAQPGSEEGAKEEL